MAVTMRDVAQRAGVSIKTVSRVVNNQREISDETRRRVLALIQELGYRPNVYARGLVSGRTLSIALVIPQITDPFFPEMVLGVESVASAHGYSVFLCNTNEDPAQELAYIDLLAGKQVDGVILCGSQLNAAQLTEVARRHRVAVLTSHHPSHTAVVSIRGEWGLYQITSHLIGLGHRAIGHVGMRIPSECDRLEGYQRALREHGLAEDSAWMAVLPRISIEGARAAARNLLQSSPEITAISCYNDLAAIGVLQACADLGRQVPQDLAVVGFDDLELAALVSPKLTTMRVERHALGQMVMQMLLRVIEHDGDYEEQQHEVTPRLIVRESCGGQVSLN